TDGGRNSPCRTQSRAKPRSRGKPRGRFRAAVLFSVQTHHGFLRDADIAYNPTAPLDSGCFAGVPGCGIANFFLAAANRTEWPQFSAAQVSNTAAANGLEEPQGL